MQDLLIRLVRRKPQSAASVRPTRQIFGIEWLETRNLFSSTFTLVSSFSTLTISGSINDAPVSAQYAGGLTDQFSGATQCAIVGSNLNVQSGTVTASSSGTALPGSSAANFAGVYDGINFAIRDLVFNVSGDITLGGGGYFTANGTATATTGEVDIAVGGNTDTFPIAGSLVANQSVIGNGSVRTSDGSSSIILPIHEVLDQTIDSVPFNLNFDGEVVMAGTVGISESLSGSTLVITGTPAGDNIAVTKTGDEIQVVANEATQDFPLADVTQVSVLGGLGPDQISIGANVPQSIVIGGLGEDNISAANAANDTLSGSGGQDTITLDGSSGNDLIKGSYGPDSLGVGTGTGNDTLIGGLGFDDLSGGSGANLLAGGDGADTILGGTGHETLDGGVGANQITPGANDSVIQ